MSDGETVPTGFEAMGNPVPNERKTAALNHLREMHSELSTEEEMELVGKVASAIERDEPYEAMEAAREVLDETGSYRLLAVVCAGGIE